MKVNLEVTEKPSNLQKYNISVHIIICTENQVCVGHWQERLRKEMGDQSLLLTGSNGLIVFDQESTRFNIFVFEIG